MSKPRIAAIPGDPSGIGPELLARLVNQDGVLGAADIVLVGDAHLWRRGAEQAGLDVELDPVEEDDIGRQSGLSHLDLDTIDPDSVRVGEVTKAGGTTSLRCLDKALDLAQAGLVDGILFGPFNKAAMTEAGLNAEDEHRYMARYLGFAGYHGELNVLDDLMTTRVTSRIALRDVADAISEEAVLDAVTLASDTLKRAGKTRPAIAVAALNPHAGDNGKFGTEEIDLLAPAVEKLAKTQMAVSGPWPSDTVFRKAVAGEIDAVVTMYHDQGQIALKLLGFDRGVTVQGGLPIPVSTPAHGTAFDIAGTGVADLGAMRAAFDIACRMVSHWEKEAEEAA